MEVIYHIQKSKKLFCESGETILHKPDTGAIKLAKKMLDTIKEV